MKKTLLLLKTMLATITLVAFSTSLTGQITTLPIIDGDSSDVAWATSPLYPIDSIIALPNTDDDADFSGSMKALWSDDSLYVLVVVNDDIHFTESSDHYTNDNFVIYLDLHNLKTSAYLDSTQAFWEIYWYDRDHAGRVGQSEGENWSPRPANIGKDTLLDDGHYVGEVAIAWNDLEEGFAPAADDTMGFEVKINDNDGEGRNILSWYDKTDQSWTDPGVFNTIVLNADGTIEQVQQSEEEEEEEVVSVFGYNDQTKIELYPNPVERSLNISTSGQINEISIVNVTGQVEYQTSNLSQKEVHIDVSNFQTGVYGVIIKTQDQTIIRKIIKN